MVMAAKFYTDAELKTASNKAVEIAADGVASFYSDVGSKFGRALFFTCMRLWKSGPADGAAHCRPRIAIYLQTQIFWAKLAL